MKTLRTLTGHVNAPFDRITSPHFARELHGLSQAFMALLAGFAVTAWIVAEPHIGLILCVLGIAAVPPAWLIATLTARMALEVAMVILSIHQEFSRQTHSTSLRITESATGPTGKELEE
ncbi:DUF4282 domain-containing protein [Actinomadura rupiterrae]|uniref:DUF4282 domain-containing protein n=1 Tax=Actinomadura rupiterrae TaxID=559627 RepID=UPI0020A30B39|nr:DUF4282 domain-containing protein [Actinomadura rupiterrae]MCP2341627.1 hypothetical protein [Actinomadura rupiterrae]